MPSHPKEDLSPSNLVLPRGCQQQPSIPTLPQLALPSALHPRHTIVPTVILVNGRVGFKMCFATSTFGAGGNTRLESSIKKFQPHLINDCYDENMNDGTVPQVSHLTMRESAYERSPTWRTLSMSASSVKWTMFVWESFVCPRSPVSPMV